jgi:hypothetical protein
MFFLFIKVVDIDFKEDVTLALQSAGITKASYIESWDLEKSFSDEFALFRGFLSSEKRGEQVIMTALAEEKSQISDFLNALRAAGIDIDKKEILRLISLPVASVFDWELGFIEF